MRRCLPGMRRKGRVREYWGDGKLAGVGCVGKEDRGLRVTASHLEEVTEWMCVLRTETEIEKEELVWEPMMWGSGLDTLRSLWNIRGVWIYAVSMQRSGGRHRFASKRSLAVREWSSPGGHWE